MLILKDHSYLVSPARRQHPYVWLRDFILAQTRGYDEDIWRKSVRIVIVHFDTSGRPAGRGIDKTNKVIQAKVQTLERNLSRTRCKAHIEQLLSVLMTSLGAYITHNLHKAAPTAPTDSLRSLARCAFSPPTPIPLLTPLSPPRHPLLPRSAALPRALEENVESDRWEDTISAISNDPIRKEIDDEFRLGVVTRGRDCSPHPPGELQVEVKATAPAGLCLGWASSTVPPTLIASASLPRHIQCLVHTPPEPIDTTGSWSHMGIYHYSGIYYVEFPISLTATTGISAQQVLPSAKEQVGVDCDLWLKGCIQTGIGETRARSAVYWRSAHSGEGDEPQHLEQYDQLEAVEWEVLQEDQGGPPDAAFNTPPATNPETLTAQKSALIIRQFASGFFDIVGSQLVPAAVQGV